MSDIKTNEEEGKKSLNFIEAMVEKDLAEGKNKGRVQTRFPPEPNGYLHIGHAKAICLDFGIAQKYGGVCNLRFDDTNPVKEDLEYVDAIKEDIEWLGYHWNNIYYASDYFQQLWDFAIQLIKEGKAYIDEQTSEQIASQKGTPTQPGTNSPYRDRPIEENLELFHKMNSGELEVHVWICHVDLGTQYHRTFFQLAAVHLPYRQDSAPPYGRQVESIPDVRLCTRTERLLRRCHSLVVYT